MPAIGTGTALLIRDRKLGQHLYFVLTDPDVTNRVVTVLLVTAKRHTDRTTALIPGDHPFVRRESHVDFGTARFVPVSKLSDALLSGRAILQPPMAAELVERVRAGLLMSAHTIHAVSKYCRPIFAAPDPKPGDGGADLDEPAS